MRRLFTSISAVFTGILFLSSTGQPDLVREEYAKTITAEDLKKHLSILASDEYEGRETAKKGQFMAAEYIATQFHSFGIPALPGEGIANDPLSGYYQMVPLLQLSAGEGIVTANNAQYTFGKDFYYTAGIDDVTLSLGKIVFAGYGIQDSLYRDYDGIDVKGKAVMVLDEDPRDANGNSIITGTKEFSSWTTQRRQKTNEAQKQGAALLLIVLNDFQKRYSGNKHYIESPTLKLDEPDAATKQKEKMMPVLYISKTMADDLLKNSRKRKTVEQLQEKIAKKKKPAHLEFSIAFSLEIQRKAVKLSSQNVLGYIEGSDLKDELVVVTAHYDHLGKDSTVVFNGADDDGSGTVAVLELAEAFAKAKKDGHGPRRSMLFMTVTGEEKGLLGSRWYTNHPVFPLEKTVCDLNIDMIGRVDEAHKKDTNYVYVIGSDKLSSELKTINEKENAMYTGMTLDYRFDAPNEPNSFYTRSDHYNFAKHGIPVAFFFNGVHSDYHKETDEVQKINFPLLQRRAQLVFFTAWELANRDKRIVVDNPKK